MKKSADYIIDIFKLKNGLHEYEFSIKDNFFDEFEESLIEKGFVEVKVSLDKGERLINVGFMITGHLTLTCDRSLREFDESISLNEKVLYQYGDVEESDIDNDEIIVISKNTQSISLAKLLYEFLTLSLPMKKLHPELRTEEVPEDGMLVYRSGSEVDNSNESSKTPPIDPRWAKLKGHGSEEKNN